MTMDEDRDGFATEYVLGTLDAEERAQADALMLVDEEFASKVRQWERRLGELNVLVAPIEPPAPVWGRIKAGLADAGQSGHLHLPDVAAPAMRQDARSAEIIHMTHRMQRWRGATIIGSLMAACIVGIVLVREHRPDVLPPELRPKQQVVERVVEKPVEVVREVVREVPSAQPAQFVAVFQKDERSPEFVLTVDVEKRTLMVRTVAAPRMPDRDYQIWIQPRPDMPPESLGLVSADEFTVRPTPASYDPGVMSSAMYGISLEPAGGSPTGRPTSPAMHAKLLQVTPPQRP
jgi:anti-sigma-K factor RskA